MKNIRIFSALVLLAAIIGIMTVSSCKKNTDDQTADPIPPNNNNNNNNTATSGTFTDSRDGKVYKWVKIGNQTWMAQNLNFVATTGLSFAYNNDANLAQTYGRLYDWTAAMASCPAGWHLPDTNEWRTLINYLGGTSVAGGKLREAGTAHWVSTVSAVNNSTGFTALPGGSWMPPPPNGGQFIDLTHVGQFWTKTVYSINQSTAYFYLLRCDYDVYQTSIFQNCNIKSLAMSVRCVKD